MCQCWIKGTIQPEMKILSFAHVSFQMFLAYLFCGTERYIYIFLNVQAAILHKMKIEQTVMYMLNI